MLTFAWYLLKVMLCSGILFGYYWVALRNKKFHRYNRFYLLASVMLSWIIPFLKIDFWKETASEPQVIKLLTVVANGDRFIEQTNRVTWDWNKAAILISVFISAMFLVRLIISVVKIKALISSNTTKKWNDINFVFTNAKGTPFSFFKYIFWNEQIDLNSSEGEQILKHELVHVQENHTADKIFLSLMLIISWYNPIIWLIRKELNMIHEFIADQKAIVNGDTTALASMLLKAAFPSYTAILTNSFFHSPIKRRLIMLTSNRHSRYSYLRRLLILPLITVVILFFAFRLKEKEVNAFYKHPEAASFANTENVTPAQFPGGMIEWRRYLERNLNLNVFKDNKAPVGKYAPVIVFTVKTDGSISNLVAETKAGYGTEEEAMKLIKKGPKWEPAKKDGVPVESKVRQTVNFVLTDGGALVYIDSINLIKGTQPSETSISANRIDTTNKKNRESKLFNVAFRDSSGNESAKSATVTFSSQDTGKLRKTLVVLDGKEMTWQQFENAGIESKQIKSINVFKGEAAIKKYGEKGKDGVMEITTGTSTNSYVERYRKDEQEYLKAKEQYLEKEQENLKDQKRLQQHFEEQKRYQEEQALYPRVFTVVESPPYYPKGMKGFANYISSNMQYPAEAKQAKIEGAVLIQFVVNEEGKLTDFKKLSSKGYGLEEEAIRLLKNSGDWKPGLQNGHKVPVQIQQQVIFQLP